MNRPRNTFLAEEMYDGLLKITRGYVAKHNEMFWDIFSGELTESRRFFLSLPEEQREFLVHAATMEALLVG